MAGIDETEKIGSELARQAGRHQGALSPWSAADSALSLKDSRDRPDYLERYSKLMRLRYALSTEPFPIPGKPGLAGNLMKGLKAFLWKLLRYQHDRMAHQQTIINEGIISAQEFQHATFTQRLATLEQRIRELEGDNQAGRPPSPQPSPSRGEGEVSASPSSQLSAPKEEADPSPLPLRERARVRGL